MMTQTLVVVGRSQDFLPLRLRLITLDFECTYSLGLLAESLIDLAFFLAAMALMKRKEKDELDTRGLAELRYAYTYEYMYLPCNHDIWEKRS